MFAGPNHTYQRTHLPRLEHEPCVRSLRGNGHSAVGPVDGEARSGERRHERRQRITAACHDGLREPRHRKIAVAGRERKGRWQRIRGQTHEVRRSLIARRR
jgi:hypothetical protein